jgi:hypothetical protein
VSKSTDIQCMGEKYLTFLPTLEENDMSMASLSLSTLSAFQAPVSRFESATTASSRQPSHPAEHDRSANQTFRESTLVSALMTAFQALGVAPAARTVAVAASATDSSAASVKPAASDTTAPPVASAANVVLAVTETGGVDDAARSTTATASTAATGTTGAADTLEKAVNAFAHALYSVMSRGGQESGHERHGDAHRVHGGGYNGFAQRLEQLAQSLGSIGTPAATTAATPSASVSATSDPVTSTATVPTTTSDNAATSVETAAPLTTHSRGLNRLLAAFTRVMSLLQPPSATQAASPDAASTSATSSAAVPTADSMTAKLQLFLHTLSQARQSSRADALPSALGSRVNLTA